MFNRLKELLPSLKLLRFILVITVIYTAMFFIFTHLPEILAFAVTMIIVHYILTSPPREEKDTQS